MITEEPLKGFDNKMSYKSLDYPECSCKKCPKMFWNALFVASKQSGKTHSTCMLIRHLEENKLMKNGTEYGVRTIVISPTLQANEVYTTLKSLDMEKQHL